MFLITTTIHLDLGCAFGSIVHVSVRLSWRKFIDHISVNLISTFFGHNRASID